MNDPHEGAALDRVARLAAFNRLDAAAAVETLLACCASPAGAQRMAAGRPYPSPAALLAEADAALAALTEADLDQALAGHPRIGDRPTAAHNPASTREQSGLSGADQQVLDDLAEGNREYEARFGHVYLVCASGRSAQELLGVLRQRLRNDPVTERAVMRDELGAINRLRLERLLAEPR